MSAGKNILYLLQGQAENLEKYFCQLNRSDIDALYLTYDYEIDEAIFLPNSTWAEGRNKLLEEAIKLSAYKYYIFCDDDVEFKEGGFKKFEDNLLKYNPLVAVPIVPRSKHTVIKALDGTFQSFLFNDEQMIAFHEKVVKDRVVIPYYLQFDSLHWWATCQIQEILIQTFYPYDSIQFNDVEIDNKFHDRYKSNETNENDFRLKIREWLDDQFVAGYTDIVERHKRHNLKTLLKIVYRSIGYYIRTIIFRRNTVLRDKSWKGKLKESSVIRDRFID